MNLKNTIGLIALVGIGGLLGCGAGSRDPVKGTVTVDGQPLTEGQIVFVPAAGTSSPSAGAVIKDGAFTINPVHEKFMGIFRVEITASRPTGRTVRGPRGEVIEELANYLPERYNTNSELTQEVAASGPNEFEFTLNSK